MTGLERIVSHCKGSVTVEVNGHTTSYYTVAQHFEDVAQYVEFDDDDKAAIARCIAADTVWEIQAYPHTPIGSHVCYGATLKEAVDAMLATMGLS